MLYRSLPQGATRTRKVRGLLEHSRVSQHSLPTRASTQRLFSISSCQRDHTKDVIFGATESDIEVAALMTGSSADYNLVGRSRERSVADPTRTLTMSVADAEAAIAQYERQHAEFMKDKFSLYGPPGKVTALEDFKFLPNFRKLMLAPDCRYADFMRAVLRTCEQRGGQVSFYLGAFDMFRHFADSLFVEIAREKAPGDFPFSTYINTMTMGLRDGEYRDGLPHATFTSIELGELREGSSRSIPVSYYNPSMVLIDTREFADLYDTAVKHTRSLENKQNLQATGEFTLSARSAVQELQYCVHGTFDMLPLTSPLMIDRRKLVQQCFGQTQT